MNIHYMFYIVIVSATLKLLVRFLPTTKDRLLLTEVLMGGNFQRHIYKCLWETDVKCTHSRNHDEMLAVREEGETQVTYLVPHREAAAPAKLRVCQNHL